MVTSSSPGGRRSKKNLHIQKLNLIKKINDTLTKVGSSSSRKNSEKVKKKGKRGVADEGAELEEEEEEDRCLEAGAIDMASVGTVSNFMMKQQPISVSVSSVSSVINTSGESTGDGAGHAPLDASGVRGGAKGDDSLSFSDDSTDAENSFIAPPTLPAGMAFQRQLFANFPVFSSTSGGSGGVGGADNFVRQQLNLQQLIHEHSKRSLATDSGAEDDASGCFRGKKRRKQSKPVRITNENELMTSPEEENERKTNQINEEDDHEEGQIIRNASGAADVNRLFQYSAGSAGFAGFPWPYAMHPQQQQQQQQQQQHDPSSPRSSGSDEFPAASGASAMGGLLPFAGSNPFLFPFLNSPSLRALEAHRQGAAAPSGSGASAAPIRIFNHEAYCELCNKEFCNKYFLKTHKANKHGIYSSEILNPPASGASGVSGTCGGPATTVALSSGAVPVSCGSVTVVSSAEMLPATSVTTAPLVTASYGPPLSLTVGAMTYGMNVMESPHVPVSSASGDAFAGFNAAAAVAAMGKSGSAGSGADFFPMWMTPPTSGANHSKNRHQQQQQQQQQGASGASGIVNPEAYCELCQKEFCNKYFLKRHKAKMHGIVADPAVSSAGSTPTSTPTSASGNNPPTAKKIISSVALKTHPPPPLVMLKNPLLPAAELGTKTQPECSPEAPEGVHQEMMSCDSNGIDRRDPEMTDHDISGMTATSGMSAECGSMGIPRFDLCRDSLSLLKIPTPTLSMFAMSPPGGASGGASGEQQQQQRRTIFSPERLRQMGVINTEAFCEICCKEFCNKYFLRTHKYKKHGVGSMPDPPSLPAAQKFTSGTSGESDQTIPLNLAAPLTSSTPLATSLEAPEGPEATGSVCEVCNRPFQSAYLLHMHKTYFHGSNPEQAEEGNVSDQAARAEVIKTEAAEAQPEEEESDAAQQQNISHDLQKLQSMIMELNGTALPPEASHPAALHPGQHPVTSSSSTSSSSSLEFLRRMEKINCGNYDPSAGADGPRSIHHDQTQMMNSGGGIVKIVTSSPPHTPISSAAQSTVCTACNKDFMTEYLLKLHLHNYHGTTSGISTSGDDVTPTQFNANERGGLKLSELLDLHNNGTSGALNSLMMSGSQSGSGGGGGKKAEGGGKRISSTPTRSYCEICNKELCNKYFMKTHMLKMHGINLESGGTVLGGVTCDICNKELCSKYFLKVHKQNTHGIYEHDSALPTPTSAMLPMTTNLSKDGVMDLSVSFHRPADSCDSPQKTIPAPTSGTSGENCPVCPKRFRSLKSLKVHLSQEHGIPPTPTPLPEVAPLGECGSRNSGFLNTPQSCYICSQSFNDVVALQVHLIKQHASHLDSPTSGHQNPGKEAPPEAAAAAAASLNLQQLLLDHTPKTFRCSFCDFATASLPYLFAHERSHQPPQLPVQQHPPELKQQIQCPLCQHQLPLEHFQHHLMSHQLPNFLQTLIPSASAPEAPPEDYEDEEEEEEEEEEETQQQLVPVASKRFRCSVCRKKFPTRPLCLRHILARHPAVQLTPSGSTSGSTSGSSRSGRFIRTARAFSCPRCGYSTTHPQLLRMHLRQQQCIPVIARNADLQQLPPYLGMPPGKQDFVLQAFLMAHPPQHPKSNGLPQVSLSAPELLLPVSQGEEAEEEEEAAKDAQEDHFIPSVILLPVNRRIAKALSVTFSLTPA